ncbi:MAG: NAD-dependent epimerase/dehydratase, partial [Candidatus Woesebacteria bacterium GW2011_GWA1_38_8]
MGKKVLVTGSGGLVGSEAVHFFCQKDFQVYGVDNNMRAYFFGDEASTDANVKKIKGIYKNYHHIHADVRDQVALDDIFKNNKFDLIIHTAAQPSHDWAAREPDTDFTVNANGTLNLLEGYRKYSPEAIFIYTSTNKVYGDTPNKLPLVEKKTRYEIESDHPFYNGIDESMSIDNSTHSLFGVSKTSADLMVQEYGKYFHLPTGVFRGGCLTGSGHAGTQLHGFLSYLVKAILLDINYTIFGYKGKQVRDNIHSHDLINAFYEYYKNPRFGEVYNIGGSRFANVSMLEAIDKIQNLTGRKARYEYNDKNRIGDHIWYVSSVKKFQDHFPKWKYEYNIDATIEDICKNSAFSKKYYSFKITKNLDYWKEKNWYFHNAIQNIFKSYIPENSSVLQIGYGLGDALASLYPKIAVSIDDDESLIEISRTRFPSVNFVQSKPEEMKIKGKFDYAILPNSIVHFYDIQKVLENISRLLNVGSKVVMTTSNPKWEPIFSILEKLNLKRPENLRNWLRLKDIENIFEISGFEIEESGYSLLIPTHFPFISNKINNLIKGSGFLSKYCAVQYIVAKKSKPTKSKKLSCTVLIPCFNEEENIEKAIATVPKMGKKTEIVVVDGGSSDKTSKIVKHLMKRMKNVKLITYKTPKSKGYAVKMGFDGVATDVMMIQDADMTVPPEELIRFYKLLANGKAKFVNGTRLFYPMEDQAMRNLNLIGNIIFGHIFSWLLGQRITDTLCGTKAMFKKDYKKIKMSGTSWGDFDLLFGASENKLNIIEL